MRSRRAGLKRTGLLALALVLALGALGVAYAAWTDSAYVQGTIETGTLDADICGVSSTFAYKDLDGVIHMEYVYGNSAPTVDEEWELKAWATTLINPPGSPEEDIDSAEMTFSGVFPGYDFMTDIELEYLGSVPAKISFAGASSTDTGENYDIFNELWQMGIDSNHTQGIWIDAELSTNGGLNWTPVADPLGLPLHLEDLVHINMHVLLPADSDYGSRTLNFSGQVNVIQWNKYEES